MKNILKIYFLIYNMALDNINEKELSKQLSKAGIDLNDVPVDMMQRHLDEVGTTIEDPEELTQNLASFIEQTR